ncbi:MAG: polysaccharide deacetylase family protein [Candidatus Xiphinematobacter sp.]|nr:MAG: polysaccharide deacetylase family protein [Candidatus Xiphinematobacter sp.]QQY11022.1 MAG: polysaccharide deacetylase family protein [Candidatus Xiphinematobacter sp.]
MPTFTKSNPAAEEQRPVPHLFSHSLRALVRRASQGRLVYYSRLTPYNRIFREGVPILTYHKLERPPQGVRRKDLYVRPCLFKKQMEELWKEGFCTTHLRAQKNFAQPKNNRLVITFDDGSRTVFQHAMVPLWKLGFTAIQYLVTEHIGGRNEWDTLLGEVEDPLMDESQVRTWLSAGHKIGAHTLTHPHLTYLDRRQAREEIASSKKKLEDMFGVAVQHFCYPYGSWKVWVRDLVEEAGYKTAVTTDPGICHTNAIDPFILPRISVRQPPMNLRGLLDRLLSFLFL